MYTKKEMKISRWVRANTYFSCPRPGYVLWHSGSSSKTEAKARLMLNQANTRLMLNQANAWFSVSLV